MRTFILVGATLLGACSQSQPPATPTAGPATQSATAEQPKPAISANNPYSEQMKALEQAKQMEAQMNQQVQDRVENAEEQK
jgi:ribulose kinase